MLPMTADSSVASNLRLALAEGAAAVAAWADVLDRINVFPVPDGDTGRNLVLSLGVLRDLATDDVVLVERLLMDARGNSGNIASAFLRAMLDNPEDEGLGARCVAGAAAARRAVANPQPGTMLTVFDVLAETAVAGLSADNVPSLLARLTMVVHETSSQLEPLRAASVVDSGALGMLVFFDRALRAYYGLPERKESLASCFRSLVRFDRSAAEGRQERGFCIDAVLRMPEGAAHPDRKLAHIGSEVVALREGTLWKVHLHAENSEAARAVLGEVGEVLAWSWDDLGTQLASSPPVAAENEVHVVTDGAASLSRSEAESLGVTLLDSHVDFGGRSLPETRLDPDDVYRAMRRGVRVSTAQASTYERHMHYERLTAQWKRILYLCVGSVYTGNYAVAVAWCASQEVGERLTIIDSGVASGKLAVVVRAVVRAAKAGARLAELSSLAQASLARVEEYIFVERLEYLARGGRLSKTGAWFGDALGLAPVVSPFPDGARKVALLRKPGDRLSFACKQVARAFDEGRRKGYLLAQYTDNRGWVESTVVPRLRQIAHRAEIAVGPLSLTTGAHTGPGTWAVAMLPEGGG